MIPTYGFNELTDLNHFGTRSDYGAKNSKQALSRTYQDEQHYRYLLYRHECFTGKYTTRRIHMKLHPGLEWRIFHILTSEDIDDFTDIKFVS